MNLEQLTKELKIEKIDQVIGGVWTTAGGSSGGNDHIYIRGVIGTPFGEWSWNWDIHLSFT